MDFSTAQRRAFIDEYVALRFESTKGLAQMSAETQQLQRDQFTEEATEFLVGCSVHFQRSVMRLTSNGALVPRDRVPIFERLIRVLLSDTTTLDQFDAAVLELREGFPSVSRWLDWWLQPLNASMIFPVKSTVAPSTRQDVPRTSNPVEAKHSLLHRASGTEKGLISGLEGMLLYVQEIEALYEAIKSTSFFLHPLSLVSDIRNNFNPFY